jgi:glutamyl-tRNA synthetase
MSAVRTRFAPSPTGYLHIGGARTALFSWLYARSHRGSFVLRIEDTDRERSTQEAVEAIIEGLAWLGLDYDEGPYFQTERSPRYREVIERLLTEDQAYYCYCSKERLEALRAEQMARKEKPRYDGRCRHARGIGTDPVVRFKNPVGGQVLVEDRIRGRVLFQNSELDDLIIARADGTPTYNLCVVVDDADMGITHVIRGDDHLNNTPRQINILRALGSREPVYAHVPMILGADGKRLSKRHGAVSVLQYRDEGYLPGALLNYLVRLGWSHGDQEVFSIDEMIERFDIAAVNKAAATFNPGKLQWLNQQYLKAIGTPELTQRLRFYLDRLQIRAVPPPELADVVQPLRERSKTLMEMASQARIYYVDEVAYEQAAAARYLSPESLAVLKALRGMLAGLASWAPEAIHPEIIRVAEQLGLKLAQIAQPLRVALCGGTVSPPIDVTLGLIGRERCLWRIDRAIAAIEGLPVA